MNFVCHRLCSLLPLVCWLGVSVHAQAQDVTSRPRARAVGIPFDGTPGPLNAITDVAGVEVGHATLIMGKGALHVGKGPVRTGVTAILPRGRADHETPVFAGWYSLNGNGEMTGTTWVEESGFLQGPIAITNTHSVGTVRDSVIAWQLAHLRPRPAASDSWWSLPVIAETYDGWLNDIDGFHVTRKDVFKALNDARGGPVGEGNVGGGTGMKCNGYKGGIGTASRRLTTAGGGYTLGVLVQCNYGLKQNLVAGGIPVGRALHDDNQRAALRPRNDLEVGSIIVVVATDAPLLPHQLKRVARRVPLGLGRTGSTSGNGSGDIFIAFSTANAAAAAADQNPSEAAKNTSGGHLVKVEALPNGVLDSLFDATVQATEEAILNAMMVAQTMVGRDDHRVEALPIRALQDVLAKHDRLVPEAQR